MVQEGEGGERKERMRMRIRRRERGKDKYGECMDSKGGRKEEEEGGRGGEVGGLNSKGNQEKGGNDKVRVAIGLRLERVREVKSVKKKDKSEERGKEEENKRQGEDGCVDRRAEKYQ